MAQPVPPRAAPSGTIYRSSRGTLGDRDPDRDLPALLRGVADRDSDAFAALYAVLAPALWSDVVSGGFSPADADAVLASTFVEVWQLANFEIDNDTQFVEWIRRSIGRRCAERRMRGPAPAPRSAGSETTWWYAAEEYDKSAKQAIEDLLGGRVPADPADPTDPAEPAEAQPSAAPKLSDGRLPAATDEAAPETRRPRRADLGAVSAFGHRRSGAAPVEPGV